MLVMIRSRNVVMQRISPSTRPTNTRFNFLHCKAPAPEHEEGRERPGPHNDGCGSSAAGAGGSGRAYVVHVKCVADRGRGKVVVAFGLQGKWDIAGYIAQSAVRREQILPRHCGGRRHSRTGRVGPAHKPSGSVSAAPKLIVGSVKQQADLVVCDRRERLTTSRGEVTTPARAPASRLPPAPGHTQRPLLLPGILDWIGNGLRAVAASLRFSSLLSQIDIVVGAFSRTCAVGHGLGRGQKIRGVTWSDTPQSANCPHQS